MRADDIRSYEMVTPEELRQTRSNNLKYPELYRAIRALKEMAPGEGIKLRCPSAKDAMRKRKAVALIARREKLSVRTMLRGEWLFVEKVGSR